MRFRLSSLSPSLLFLLFCLLFVWKTFEVRQTYKRGNKILNEDALGYHILLPALLRYQDPSYQFLISEGISSKESFPPAFVNQVDDSIWVCKYFSGVAILQTPFYLLASVFADANEPILGQTYQDGILISVIFYVLLACLILYRRFLALGMSDLSGFLLIIFVLFGTNLYAYTTYDPAYSHSYSFFAVTLFIESLLLIKKQGKRIYVVLSLLALGLIVVIRPLNGILVFLIPIVFNWKDIHAHFLGTFSKTLINMLALAFFPLVQSAAWYWQTGQWVIYSYGEETLHLNAPRMLDFLFSYDCGWVIYTPSAFLLAVSGITLVIRYRKYKLAIGSALFALTLIYLLSSWYYLHYGCTAGCRPITEYYGLMALLFAYSWPKASGSKPLRMTLIPLLLCTFLYNRVVQFQFFEHIINWCSMDRNRFAMVFMRTHEAYRYSTYPFWDFGFAQQKQPVHTRNLAVHLAYNESFEFHTGPIDAKDSSLLIRFRGRAKTDSKTNYIRILLTDKDKYVDQQTLLLIRKIALDNEWHDFEFQFPIHQSLSRGKFWIKLESTNENQAGELFLDSVDFRRL